MVTVLETYDQVTPAGTPYQRRIVDTTTGRRATVYVPASHAATDPLLLFFHGASEDHGYIEDYAQMKPVRDHAMDNGWVLIAPDQRLLFGNPSIMTQTLELHDWAKTDAPFTGTILYGFSMGGMAAYNASGRGLLPDLRGVVVVHGTVDSLASNALPYIRTAYGATSDADLLVKQVGYDPARDDPARWADLPMFLAYSTADTAISEPLHGRVFIDRAATPHVITYRVDATAHSVIAGFRHAEIIPWMTALVAPPGITFRTVDGRAVTLRRIDGTRVALSLV